MEQVQKKVRRKSRKAKAGAERRQHSRPGREGKGSARFLIVKAGFHTGFTIRVLRKEFRGDEPGRKGKGRPQLSTPATITVTWTIPEITVCGMTGWEPLRTEAVPIGVLRPPGIRLF
jgi:hypothetical protein